MMKNSTINELKWDTEFFNVKCAQVIMKKKICKDEWEIIKKNLYKYEFISIINKNSEPVNAKFIAENTNAYLIDINIQFNKAIEEVKEKSKTITICNMLQPNTEILELADFQYSKFIDDPMLFKRGGEKVYINWVENSFNKKNKYFAISKNAENKINGFLLYSYSDNACVIELIAISKNDTKSGIGTKLFNTVENTVYEQGYNTINVGTQIKNTNAINFYHKLGFKQIESHQVYHLWNI